MTRLRQLQSDLAAADHEDDELAAAEPEDHEEAEEDELAAMKGATIGRVLDCLEERFQDFEDNPIFRHSGVFDHSCLPCDSPDHLQDFGKESVQFLLDHFCAVLEAQGCDIEAVQREWSDMKLFISKNQHPLALNYQKFRKQFFVKAQLARR